MSENHYGSRRVTLSLCKAFGAAVLTGRLGQQAKDKQSKQDQFQPCLPGLWNRTETKLTKLIRYSLDCGTEQKKLMKLIRYCLDGGTEQKKPTKLIRYSLDGGTEQKKLTKLIRYSLRFPPGQTRPRGIIWLGFFNRVTFS